MSRDDLAYEHDGVSETSSDLGCLTWLVVATLGGLGVVLTLTGGITTVTALVETGDVTVAGFGCLTMLVGILLTWGGAALYRNARTDTPAHEAVERTRTDTNDERAQSENDVDSTSSGTSPAETSVFGDGNPSTSGRGDDDASPERDDATDAGSTSHENSAPSPPPERCPDCETPLGPYRPSAETSLAHCPACGVELDEDERTRDRAAEIRREIALRRHAIDAWLQWSSGRKLPDEARRDFVEPRRDEIADLREQLAEPEGESTSEIGPDDVPSPEIEPSSSQLALPGLEEEAPPTEIEAPSSPATETAPDSEGARKQSEPHVSPERRGPSTPGEAADVFDHLEPPEPPESHLPSSISDDTSNETERSSAREEDELRDDDVATRPASPPEATTRGEPESDEPTRDTEADSEEAELPGRLDGGESGVGGEGGVRMDASATASDRAAASTEKSPSFWEETLEPFLIRNWFYFLGAFMVLSGGIYLLSTVWTSISSVGRHLVTVGLLSAGAGGFTGIGRYLADAFPERSAGRTFELIGFGFVGLAAAASGSAVRDHLVWGTLAAVGTTTLVALFQRYASIAGGGLAPVGLVAVVGAVAGFPSTWWAWHATALHVGFGLLWWHVYRTTAAVSAARASSSEIDPASRAWTRLAPSIFVALLAAGIAVVRLVDSGTIASALPWLGPPTALAGAATAEWHASSTSPRRWAAVAGLAIGALGIGLGLDVPGGHLLAAAVVTTSSLRLHSLGARLVYARHIAGAIAWAGLVRTLDLVGPIELVGPWLLDGMHGLLALPYVGYLVYRVHRTRGTEPERADISSLLATIGIALGSVAACLDLAVEPLIWTIAAPVYAGLAWSLAPPSNRLDGYLGSLLAAAWVGLTPWSIFETPVVSIVGLVGLATVLSAASVVAERYEVELLPALWAESTLAIGPILAALLAAAPVWHGFGDWQPDPVWMGGYGAITLYAGLLVVETRRTGYRALSYLAPALVVGSISLWGYGLKQWISTSSSDRGLIVAALGAWAALELSWRLLDTGREPEERLALFGLEPFESSEPLWRTPLRHYGLAVAAIMAIVVVVGSLRFPPRAVAGLVVLGTSIRTMQQIDGSRAGPWLFSGAVVGLSVSWWSELPGGWALESWSVIVATSAAAIAHQLPLALVPDVEETGGGPASWGIASETWGHLETTGRSVFVAASTLASLVALGDAWGLWGTPGVPAIAILPLVPLVLDQIRRPARYSAIASALFATVLVVPLVESVAMRWTLVAGLAGLWLGVEMALAPTDMEESNPRRELYWQLAAAVASGCAFVVLPATMLGDAVTWNAYTRADFEGPFELVLASAPILYGLLYLRLRSIYHVVALLVALVGWPGFVVGWSREIAGLDVWTIPALWSLLVLGADVAAGWLHDRSSKLSAEGTSPEYDGASELAWSTFWPSTPSWHVDALARHHRELWRAVARWGVVVAVVSTSVLFAVAAARTPRPDVWTVAWPSYLPTRALAVAAGTLGAVGIRRIVDRCGDVVGPAVLYLAIAGAALCWIDLAHWRHWTWALAAAATAYQLLRHLARARAPALAVDSDEREEADDGLARWRAVDRTARIAFLIAALGAGVAAIGGLALSPTFGPLDFAVVVVPFALDQIRAANGESAFLLAALLSIAAFPAAATALGDVGGWWVIVVLGLAVGWFVLLAGLDAVARWRSDETSGHLSLYRDVASTIVSYLLMGSLPLWMAASLGAWATEFGLVEIIEWNHPLAKRAVSQPIFLLLPCLYVALYLRLHRRRYLAALTAILAIWPLWFGAWSASRGWGGTWLSLSTIWACETFVLHLLLRWRRVERTRDDELPERRGTSWRGDALLERHAHAWRRIGLGGAAVTMIAALGGALVPTGASTALVALGLWLAPSSGEDDLSLFVATTGGMLAGTALGASFVSSGRLGLQMLPLACTALITAATLRLRAWFGPPAEESDDSRQEAAWVERYHRVGFTWMVLSIPLVGLGTTPFFALEFPMLGHAMALAALGGLTALWSWEPVASGREWPAYVGAAGLFGIYGYLRLGMGIGEIRYDSWMMLVLGGGVLCFETALERAGRDVWRRVTLRMGLALPWIALLFGTWHPEAFPSGLLAGSSVFYVVLGWHFNRRGLYVPAALLCNLEVVHTWVTAGWTHPLLVALPAGLTLVAFAWIYRDSLSPAGRNGLRTVGCLAIYASNAWEMVAAHTVVDVLALAALSCVGIAAGILFRIRSYLYLGTIVLVGDVVFNMFRLSLHDRHWAAFFLFSTGLAVIGIGVYYRLYRESVQSTLDDLRRELDDWE
jgi:hypothetical protein